MKDTPYYVLTACCPLPGEHPLYFLIGDTPLPTVPGVYQFGGVDQYDLVRGKCYTVTQQTTPLTPTYPFIPAGVNFTYLENGCNDVLCGCKSTPCFVLTNCETELVLYSTNSNLLQYAQTQSVVNILGYEGCWTVETSNGLCDCAVSITVLQHFASCEECLPYVAYKLVNCNVSSQIIYTTQDLLEYIGATVSLDCGGCWTVEQIDYQPPSEQVVTIVYTFDSCIDCQREHYILQDCAGIEDPIYTYTDLSAYIGHIIQIKGCDTCWDVAISSTPVNSGVVTLAKDFVSCQECLNSMPCNCGTVANYDTVTHIYKYLDCNGAQQIITLRPNEVSNRVCLREWVTAVRPTDNFQYFGNCVNGVCPPKEYPKRTVTPGYDTPGCSAEKFDRITCQASEIYYKMVLEKRYGISSCCGEENDKILLRKELIDLQALVDPDYICTPVETCCCPTPAEAGYISLEITNPTCPTPAVPLNNYLLEKCCALNTYWTLPNDELTSLTTTTPIADCQDLYDLYIAQINVFTKCLDETPNPQDCLTAIGADVEISGCGRKTLKFTTKPNAEYLWFVENNDHSLSVYYIVVDGIGGYTIYSTVDCCTKTSFALLSNNETATYPAPIGTVTGTGFLDWYNRYATIKFNVYFDSINGLCMVEPNVINEYATIQSTENLIGQVVKASDDNCYTVVAKTTNAPTVIWLPSMPRFANCTDCLPANPPIIKYGCDNGTCVLSEGNIFNDLQTCLIICEEVIPLAIQLTTTSFVNAGAIGNQYYFEQTCKTGALNTSPQAAWTTTGDDSAVATWELICLDITTNFTNWFVSNIPLATMSIAENALWPAGVVITPNGFAPNPIIQPNGWGGPCPGSGVHGFQMYVRAKDSSNNILAVSNALTFTAVTN